MTIEHGSRRVQGHEGGESKQNEKQANASYSPIRSEWGHFLCKAVGSVSDPVCTKVVVPACGRPVHGRSDTLPCRVDADESVLGSWARPSIGYSLHKSIMALTIECSVTILLFKLSSA